MTASKKRRLDIGAGADRVQPKSEDTPKLVCEEAASVRQKYSLGAQCVPLSGLGVGPLNRHASGSHVHTLGCRILIVDGVRVVEISARLDT